MYVCMYVCMYVYVFIIQTESRVFTGFEDRDKKPRLRLGFFIEALYRSRKHEGEVCIILNQC